MSLHLQMKPVSGAGTSVQFPSAWFIREQGLPAHPSVSAQRHSRLCEITSAHNPEERIARERQTDRHREREEASRRISLVIDTVCTFGVDHTCRGLLCSVGAQICLCRVAAKLGRHSAVKAAAMKLQVAQTIYTKPGTVQGGETGRCTRSHHAKLRCHSMARCHALSRPFCDIHAPQTHQLLTPACSRRKFACGASDSGRCWRVPFVACHCASASTLYAGASACDGAVAEWGCFCR